MSLAPLLCRSRAVDSVFFIVSLTEDRRAGEELGFVVEERSYKVEVQKDFCGAVFMK